MNVKSNKAAQFNCLSHPSRAPYLGAERGHGHIFGGDTEQHDARQSRYDHQPGGKQLTPRHEEPSPFTKGEAAEQQTDTGCFNNL